jgi:hypothetical protein
MYAEFICLWRKSSVAVSSEHGSELSGFIKGQEFLDHLVEYSTKLHER